MQIQAWYMEGWDEDDDGFDDEVEEMKKEERPKKRGVDMSALNEQRRKNEANERWQALRAAGLATYVAHNSTITCLCCGMSSSNLNDIKEKYCGNCHEFHSERLA